MLSGISTVRPSASLVDQASGSAAPSMWTCFARLSQGAFTRAGGAVSFFSAKHDEVDRAALARPADAAFLVGRDRPRAVDRLGVDAHPAADLAQALLSGRRELAVGVRPDVRAENCPLSRRCPPTSGSAYAWTCTCRWACTTIGRPSSGSFPKRRAGACRALPAPACDSPHSRRRPCGRRRSGPAAAAAPSPPGGACRCPARAGGPARRQARECRSARSRVINSATIACVKSTNVFHFCGCCLMS